MALAIDYDRLRLLLNEEDGRTRLLVMPRALIDSTLFNVYCGECGMNFYMEDISGSALQELGSADAIFGCLLVGLDKSECTCKPIDPLDRVVDGMTVHDCLKFYENQQGMEGRSAVQLTPAQKQAASEAWSAQLRAKVEDGKKADEEKERRRVTIEAPEEF